MSDKVRNPITNKLITIDGKSFKELEKKGFVYDKETESWEFPADYEQKSGATTKQTKASEKVKNPITNKMIAVNGKCFKELIKQGFEYEDGELITPDDFEMPEKKEKEKKEVRKVRNPITGKDIALGGKVFKEIVAKGFVFDDETEDWEFPEDYEHEEKKPKKRASKNTTSNKSEEPKKKTESKKKAKKVVESEDEEEEEEYYD